MALDSKHEVYDVIRNSPKGQRYSLAVLGKPVCAAAFCRLLGLGKERFQKLRQAVKANAPVPFDMRFLGGKLRKTSENRQIVHEYLEELYSTIAEAMPETSEPGTMRRMSFRRRRGKRPKVASKQSKMKGKQKHVMRLLPPGTFGDYLNLLRARFPGRKISLKLFSAETWQV